MKEERKLQIENALIHSLNTMVDIFWNGKDYLDRIIAPLNLTKEEVEYVKKYFYPEVTIKDRKEELEKLKKRD